MINYLKKTENISLLVNRIMALIRYEDEENRLKHRHQMAEKAKDISSVIRYIRDSQKSKISLDELKKSSGAEPLRVDAIMYELYLSGILQPSAYSCWGFPIEYIVPNTMKALKNN